MSWMPCLAVLKSEIDSNEKHFVFRLYTSSLVRKSRGAMFYLAFAEIPEEVGADLVRVRQKD